MAEYLIQSDTLTEIGDAIREKTGKTNTLSPSEMASEISNIETGIDTADATAVAGDILSGKTAYGAYGKITGTIAAKTYSNLSASGATVTVPAGYYAAQATKSVATATQATPSISVNSSGLITASATQTAGYVNAGTKSGTKQLFTQAAKTVTPSSSVQTAVNSGVYTTGEIKVAAIPSSYTHLNFTVVGGTSQPISPNENTIWVNTSTTISSWVFSATQPSNPSNGMVWISTGTSSAIEFNALKNNGIQVYPISAKQYISSTWVDKNAMSYIGGAWKSWLEVIDFDFTNWTKKNPYPSRTYAAGTYDLSNKTLKGYVTGSYQHVVLVKNEKVNFSSSNQLKFVYSLSRNLSSYGAIIVKVSSSNSDPTDASCVVNQQIIEYATNTEVAIDVSSLSSSYYLWIGLAVWGSAGTVNFEVSNLHLL